MDNNESRNSGENLERRDSPLLRVVPTTLKSGHGLDELHPDFHASLMDVSDESLIGGLDPRKYQLDATRNIRDGMLNGAPKGQLIIGTGGGKTSVAMNLLEQTRGRALYVAPSRIAVQRAQDEMRKLGMSKNAQRMGEDRFDPSADITFATWQMLLSGDRYSAIPPELFDCCVFDEAHHFLGPQVRQLVNHFRSYQLHMTATPDNASKSLNDVVPHRYFHYTSDELVKNDGFPSWLLFRHEVDHERLNEAEVIGDRFSIKDGGEDRFLNMSHRWAICANILRERLPQGAKTIVYLPSLHSSQRFVEEIVNRDPILKQYAGKIVHVDGKMSHRDIEEIERRFGLPPDHPDAIVAVCGKDLWTESLDVPDISDVVLADPCASIRVFLQRIGRGSRPAEGKEHVRIHDVVSTVNRLNVQLAPGSKRPVTVAGVMGLQKYHDGIVLNGPYKNMYWDTAGTSTDIGEYRPLPRMSSKMIPFTERNLDLTFLQDYHYAYALFEKFAEVLGTNVFNLAFYREPFLKRDEEVTMRHSDGRAFKITFQDFVDATEFFGTIDFIEQKTLQGVDALRAEIRRSFSPAARLLMGIGSAVEKDEAIRDYGCEIPKDPFDISRLENRTFVCPDTEMKKLWRYIFARIQKEEDEGKPLDKLVLSFEELKGILPIETCEAMMSYWANPDEHYSGMGDFSEIAKLNNIFASYSKAGIEVNLVSTRDYWRCSSVDAPAYMVLEKFHFCSKGSVQGPGFDKYYLRGYESDFEQIDALETTKESPEGVIHVETAKMVIDAIAQGRDYIIIDKAALDNSIGLVLSEVFSLMGLSSEKVRRGCGADKAAREGRPWNFVNVVQLPDGTWKVPIGHVKLQLLLKSEEFAFAWKKTAKQGWTNELFQKIVDTFSLSADVPDGVKRAFEFVKHDIVNVPDSGSDVYQCTSEEELKIVEALAKLYGVTLVIGKGNVIEEAIGLNVKGCRAVEKPKAAKLVKVKEEGGDEYKISGVMQRYPLLEGLDKELAGVIYTTLQEGAKSLRIMIDDSQMLVDVCDAIFKARAYFKAFGYKGDVLDVIGPVSADEFTISLEGLAI